jgi:hypothetical protein
MAATMDFKYQCTHCGQRSGINIEIEPVAAQAFVYEAGASADTDEVGLGSLLLRLHPWEDHSYPEDNGVAERAALEVQEVS